jgi:hypothetical protein
MIYKQLVICELKGHENSNPMILTAYPNSDTAYEEYHSQIPNFLPYGVKLGDFREKKIKKYRIITYIFRISSINNRDNLASISIILDKTLNSELYKMVLKEIIDLLDKNNILNERILENNLKEIYEGINTEKDIQIENISINLSEFFKENKPKFIKEKPKLKGSF